jgi:hypothetical protein
MAESLLQHCERLPDGFRTRYHDDVISLCQFGMKPANDLSQPSAHSIARNGFPQFPAGYKAITIVLQSIGRQAQNQIRMTIHPAIPAQSLEILGPAQPKPLVHARLRPSSGQKNLLRVPIDLLDVIRRDSQFMPPARAASLKHIASAARVHALAETVYPLPAANLRLPCSLG